MPGLDVLSGPAPKNPRSSKESSSSLAVLDSRGPSGEGVAVGLSQFQQGLSIDEANTPQFLPRPWVPLVVCLALIGSFILLLAVKVEQTASGTVTSVDDQNSTVNAEISANFRPSYGDELEAVGLGRWAIDRVSAQGEGKYALVLQPAHNDDSASVAIDNGSINTDSHLTMKTREVTLLSALVRGIGG